MEVTPTEITHQLLKHVPLKKLLYVSHSLHSEVERIAEGVSDITYNETSEITQLHDGEYVTDVACWIKYLFSPGREEIRLRQQTANHFFVVGDDNSLYLCEMSGLGKPDKVYIEPRQSPQDINETHNVASVKLDYGTQIQILLKRPINAHIEFEGNTLGRSIFIKLFLERFDEECEYLYKHHPYDLYCWMRLNLIMLDNYRLEDFLDLYIESKDTNDIRSKARELMDLAREQIHKYLD